MTREVPGRSAGTKVLLGAVALFFCASQGFAVLGFWRRHARRAAIVGTSVAASNAEKQSAAAQQSAAAAQQSAAAETAAKPAAPAAETPTQKLQELESLYEQGLISESDYNAAKAKILAQITQ